MGDQGTSGGNVARKVAARDEERQAIEGQDAGVTNVEKHDKVQPTIPTRADNEGANS